MGFSMDSIHAPTIPSGPTSHASTNGTGTSNVKSLKELILQKERLEAELSALGSVLDSHGVNMNTSLTSFDGYPRADIDVAQIRTTRAQIIRLKNDHKALMKELEETVHAQFAAASNGTNNDEGSSALASRSNTTTDRTAPVTNTDRASDSSTVDVPFARVNSVVQGSPAEAAGLMSGDQVTVFGNVNWTNHERLSKVAQCVQQNENRSITVKVLRQRSAVELALTPRKDWGGRGLLGCHLVPI